MVLHVISSFFFFSKKIAKYGFRFQFELSNSIYAVIIFIRKNQKMEFIFQCEAALKSKKRFQHSFRFRFKERGVMERKTAYSRYECWLFKRDEVTQWILILVHLDATATLLTQLRN